MYALLQKQAVLAIMVMLLSNCRHFNNNLSENASFQDSKSFVQSLKNKSLSEREKEIFKQVLSGNFPSFLKELTPIKIPLNIKGKTHQAILYAMPDYFSIGTNEDYLRIPMTPILAQKIADHLHFMLPTTKIVDLIYQNAPIKLKPSPLAYGPDMVTPQKFLQHNQIIAKQLTTLQDNQGTLISGHKKDIVISNRLYSQPRQVAIYGWHRKNGRPIQPLSLVHNNEYADYSHGLRLISRFILLDGEKITMEKVLQDPELAPFFSSEGIMPLTRIPQTTHKNLSSKRTVLPSG